MQVFHKGIRSFSHFLFLMFSLIFQESQTLQHIYGLRYYNKSRPYFESKFICWKKKICLQRLYDGSIYLKTFCSEIRGIHFWSCKLLKQKQSLMKNLSKSTDFVIKYSAHCPFMD